MCLLILWVLVSSGSPLYYIGAVIIYGILEFFIAIFSIENEISALREVHKEMKYLY